MSVEREPSRPELNRHTMIQYLLGELPPAWQEHFEEQFFTDNASFEELKRVEDQLVDDYVSEVLPAHQHARFESHYLNSDRRRQKLKFAQTLKQSLAELPPVKSSFGTSLRRAWCIAWQTPALRYTFAGLSFLVLALSGLLVWSALRLQPEQPPAGTERAAVPSPSATITPVATANASPLNTPLPIATARASTPRVLPEEVAALRLTAGSWRDEQATARTLIVTPTTKRLRLQLILPALSAYSAYRVVIETAAGQSVKTIESLSVNKNGNEQRLEVLLPLLPPNDYLLTLSGKTNSDHEEVEDYQFRIVKRP